jgi:hypothetical protein
VEHDPLKLFHQAAEFVFILGVLDALQAEVKSLFRSVEHSGSGSGFRPSRLNRLPGACAALFGSEFGGSGGTTLLPPLRPKATAAAFFFFTLKAIA